MPSAEAIAAGLRSGDRRALARVMSWIEAGDYRADQAIDALSPNGSTSYFVGITGAPGAGKSTLTSQLIATMRRAEQSVAVLAIDPSSPLSGGAILGDRIRMAEHVHDPGVYIRSMATRGELGGLAEGVPAGLRALEAFGFDWLIVETVGVGQVQVDVAEQADSTLVVINPGWGDDVQASKAGILEIADIFVVNKADRPGVDDTVLELSAALQLATPHAWKTPIVKCVGHTGEGVDALWQALLDHRGHMTAGGGYDQRRRERRLRNLMYAIHRLALRNAQQRFHSGDFADIIDATASGAMDPMAAAHQILGVEAPVR
jgi:LAO/AO transport system kinase